jgi:MFS family permease
MIIIQKMVPESQFARYAAVMSSVFVVSSASGPFVGGVIADKASWRWVFWIK